MKCSVDCKLGVVGGMQGWAVADRLLLLLRPLQAQVHFLGNLVVWLSGTAALLAYAGLLLFYLLRRQRQCLDLPQHQWDKFCQVGQVGSWATAAGGTGWEGNRIGTIMKCVLSTSVLARIYLGGISTVRRTDNEHTLALQVLGVGYALHYFPYFLVERTLFLHHYLPAYMFKICLLAAVIEHGHYLLTDLFKAPRLAKVRQHKSLRIENSSLDVFETVAYGFMNARA